MARVKAFLLAGLGFGDEGKGTVTDFLVRHYGAGLVVRYNGGSQAAHNVTDETGRHHTFAQFGSGTLAGARTHLSRFMIVNPVSLWNETRHLEDIGISNPLSMMSIDPAALVTTHLHIAANRLQELARVEKHGTTGMGVGETYVHARNAPGDALRWMDCMDKTIVRKKLGRMRERYVAEYEAVREEPLFRWFTDDVRMVGFEELFCSMSSTLRRIEMRLDGDAFKGNDAVVFEGAQGVLLDAVLGFHPHTTWSDCTFNNALELLAGFDCDVERIGVIRTFQTRHGAGPMPTHDPEFAPLLTGDHNLNGNPWQGELRAGALDLVLTRYALQGIGGVDGLAVTHADRVPNGSPVCLEYRYGGIVFEELPHIIPSEQATALLSKVATPLVTVAPVDAFCDAVAELLRVPLRLISSGPRATDKVIRL